MLHTRPLVSVVIAAYNATAYLGETLASVAAQRYDALEIIVVDDGSTDATADLVADYARRDLRVRLIRQPNAGVGAARNTGIAAASGRYIAPLDADDLWDADKIGAQVAEMERRGEKAGFAYCWVRTIDGASRPTGLQPTCVASGQVFNILLFRNFLHNASVPLFRATALKRVGGYATREEQGGVQGCEDWDLCLRVAEHYDVGVVPRVLVSYRLAGTGMSFNVAGMERSFLWMLDQVRRRNPAISVSLMRWCTGHFYLYLALKAKLSGQYLPARRCLHVAARHDAAVFFSPRFYHIWAMSHFRRWRPLPPEAFAPMTPVSLRREVAPSAPVATAARRRGLRLERWRVRTLFNARVFWALYARVERHRLAHLLGASSS
ncbi:MAG TPA: glycosyltransferase [Opitutaceae bacterium]